MERLWPLLRAAVTIWHTLGLTAVFLLGLAGTAWIRHRDRLFSARGVEKDLQKYIRQWSDDGHKRGDHV